MKQLQRFPGVSSLLSVAFCGLGILQPGVGVASAFKVTPVTIALSRRAPTALLTLKNETDRPLRFQASVYRWDQTREGKMDLSPTRDVVFFPPVFMVEAGATRKVRIGAASAFGSFEKAYRIFIEELPDLEPTASSGGSQLQIRTRMGIPIFFRPDEPEVGSRLDSAAARDGILRVSVRNTGNVHVNLRGIRVKGEGPMGNPLFEREAEGWYLLAGGSRDYAIEVPKDRCQQVARFVIEARVDETTVHQNLESTSVSCR